MHTKHITVATNLLAVISFMSDKQMQQHLLVMSWSLSVYSIYNSVILA